MFRARETGHGRLCCWPRLLPALLLCLVYVEALSDDLVGGQEAVQLLGLGAAELPLPFGRQVSSQREHLRALLVRDADLRVSRSGRQLVYNCQHLATQLPNSTQRAQLLDDRHSRPRRRQLLQLMQPSLEDPAPASLRRTSSGLPLLHRCGPGGQGSRRVVPPLLAPAPHS
jgi:hypothetical protein